ncbi:RNA polymerase sigma-70 factor [Leifsonia sp. NPDC058230]|uniref:RNA polymerase sigma-70 factor n=1 Tax=Leifsonia sp. NPDC058230 TaxID=3346391 RepID=UPI0036D8AB57
MPGQPSRGTDLDDAAEVFLQVRPRLFGIAYRMLGSASDAEDIVQDAWLRWQGADRSSVEEPRAFLATTTTRLAINFAQSARVRRETYIGPWLPEPVDTSADPTLGAERAEALEFAVLLLMEKLPPAERAAYVLREAFDYPYPRIAEILEVGEANARQLVSRARKHLAAERPVGAVDPIEQRRVLDAFVAAARSGDVGRLEDVFAADVVSYSDGGGLARASRIPVHGRTTVAKYYHAFANRFWVGVALRPIELNGLPAISLVRDGAVLAVATVTFTAQGIDQVLWVMNPEKLTRVPLIAG